MSRVSSPSAALLATLLAMPAASSRAQAPRPFFDLQPMGVTAARRPDASALGVGSGLAWQSWRGAAWLRGAADARGGSLGLRSADGELHTTLWRFGAFDLGIGGHGQFDVAHDGGRYGWASTDLRLGTRSPRYGVRVGVGATASRVPHAGIVSPSTTVGGWVRVLGVSASAEFTRAPRSSIVSFDSVSPLVTVRDTGYWIQTDSFPVHVPGHADTTYMIHSVSREASTMLNEARFALGARIADVFIDGTGGLFFGGDRAARAHGLVTATRWVSPRVAVMAGAQLRMLDPATGLSQRSVVFGLRLAPQRVASPLVDAPNAAVAAQLAVARQGDHVTLSVRAPGARRVEIMGDLTAWNPVALSRSHGDTWAVSMPLPPGVYRLNVRLDDGEWMPPPGVSRAVDAYEGTVGVLVVS